MNMSGIPQVPLYSYFLLGAVTAMLIMVPVVALKRIKLASVPAIIQSLFDLWVHFEIRGYIAYSLLL